MPSHSVTLPSFGRAARSLILVLCTAAPLMLAACSSPAGGGGTALKVSPSSQTIEVGESAQLSATQNGQVTTAVTWTSNDPAVASVSVSGLVQGLSVGSAVVSAAAVADPTLTASATITVKAAGGGSPGGAPQGTPTSIAAGDMHSVAVDQAGHVWTWGNNGLGQLGVGLLPGESLAPVAVQGLTDVVAVAAGEGHSLALESNGTVWAWGFDMSGQIGPNGSDTSQRTPVQVTGITDAIAIAAGGNISMALLSNNTVVMWGANSNGELGRGTFTASSDTPAAVTGLMNVVAIAAGDAHALAVRSDGTVWAWGKNQSGELAYDTNYPARNAPVQVAGITDATEVAAGTAFSLALLDDGTVVAWGANSVGQLGRGSTTPAFDATPAAVVNVADVVGLAAGLQHVLALRSDGAISAWGGNGSGQLGRGPTAGYSADAMDVTGVSDALLVAAGAYHSLATADGLWAWGSNLNAQLGGSDKGSSRGAPAKVWD